MSLPDDLCSILGEGVCQKVNAFLSYMKQILTAEEMRDFMDSFIERLEETFRTKAHGTAVRSLRRIDRSILSIVRDIAITIIKNHIKNEEKKGKCIETAYIYL
ncbi:MAG: hypothetical protein DSO07_11395 [Thermoproteota archaeon]|jgi:hypothetical protein|uniref:Uncharacterized protein n=1 Tax=Candidatus Methanodesulfokora washburnensis TaxID=2478471 RepID=A0A3R9PSV8_9CREN|nr:hypothetical protein [Candidatus Methanodesulfokores washburnensis]RSN71932.1 hypothetical protein D6D85_14830 [Candidatus Methanodesulfokores washburnensis]RZN61846.1 MAG: hypothetical protein EF810_04155 [Candidatus Methanodesulfokores washburnensis]TDA38566.1 MAG: hypothetical protein DSO07_11395 [Candidatus Korarchaeota archaeon]